MYIGTQVNKYFVIDCVCLTAKKIVFHYDTFRFNPYAVSII